MKTLIKNVHILTMDEQFSEIKAGYLVIEEDTIVELAPMTTLDEKRMAANQVIDGQNGILMPGMINTHTHVGMIPFRSLGDDVPDLSLIHISEPTRHICLSRMPSSA